MFWNDSVARSQLALREEQLADMRDERNYWREKAELLLDSTLFHRGEVRHHVFSKPPAPVEDPITRALAGLSHHEMESARHGDT